MKNYKYHARNVFKLLALIIISAEMGIMRFLLVSENVLLQSSIIRSMPKIFEYLSVSIGIYILGFILWLRFEKRLEREM